MPECDLCLESARRRFKINTHNDAIGELIHHPDINKLDEKQLEKLLEDVEPEIKVCRECKRTITVEPDKSQIKKIIRGLKETKKSAKRHRDDLDQIQGSREVFKARKFTNPSSAPMK